VYNQQSSHSETQETESLRTLKEALKMPEEHIIIRDLNLHHPSWGGPLYPMQHKLADNLLDCEAGVVQNDNTVAAQVERQ